MTSYLPACEHPIQPEDTHTSHPACLMPLVDTPYGPMEEEEIEEARKAVLELCPPPGNLMEVDEIRSGHRFQRNGHYLISGPEEGYAGTQTQEQSGNKNPGHQQGYKLHVAALPRDAPAVLKAVKETLQGPGCPWYKVDSKVLDNKTQPGKFITIYTENPQHLNQLASQVQTALFLNNLGPENAVIPGKPKKAPTGSGGEEIKGSDLIGSGDMEIGSSELLSMRYGTFCGDRRGGHEFEIWVPDKANNQTHNPGWVDDDRVNFAHNHPCLETGFKQVADPLHANLKQEWAQMQQQKEDITNEKRIARQQQNREKRGARIITTPIIPGSFAQQSESSTSTHTVKDSMTSRRPAPVRPMPAQNNNNNNNNLPHTPTVEEMFHRPPVVSAEELNKQRSKMGLPPPPPKRNSGGPALQ